MLQNALSRNVKESFKRVLYPDLGADQVKNLTSSFRGLVPTCLLFLCFVSLTYRLVSINLFVLKVIILEQDVVYSKHDVRQSDN